MASTARGRFVWLGMIVAGLALGAFVLAAWPDTGSRFERLPYGEVMPKTPAATPQTVRTTASVSSSADAEAELASVEDVYPLELYFHEVSPSPLLDRFISAPQPVDAH